MSGLRPRHAGLAELVARQQLVAVNAPEQRSHAGPRRLLTRVSERGGAILAEIEPLGRADHDDDIAAPS